MSHPFRPDDQDRANLFAVLRFEADVVNLMGTQGNISHEGDDKRISYQAAEEVRQSVIADLAPYVAPMVLPGLAPGETFEALRCTPPEDLIGRWDEGLTAAAHGLAAGDLDGHLLSGFSVVASVLGSGWYAGSKHVRLIDSPFGQKAQVVHALTYAVALLERNLPPNELGYRPDEWLSLARKTEIAAEELQRACDGARRTMDMFGSPAITTDTINDVVLRAELNRPTFMGTIIGQAFPTL